MKKKTLILLPIMALTLTACPPKGPELRTDWTDAEKAEMEDILTEVLPFLSEEEIEYTYEVQTIENRATVVASLASATGLDLAEAYAEKLGEAEFVVGEPDDMAEGLVMREAEKELDEETMLKVGVVAGNLTELSMPGLEAPSYATGMVVIAFQEEIEIIIPDWTEAEKAIMIEEVGEVLPFIEIDGGHEVYEDPDYDASFYIEATGATTTTADDYGPILVANGFTDVADENLSDEPGETLYEFEKVLGTGATSLIVDVTSSAGVFLINGFVIENLFNPELPSIYLAGVWGSDANADLPDLEIGTDYDFSIWGTAENDVGDPVLLMKLVGIDESTVDAFIDEIKTGGNYVYYPASDVFVLSFALFGLMPLDMVLLYEYDAVEESLSLAFVVSDPLYEDTGWPAADLEILAPEVEVPHLDVNTPIISINEQVAITVVYFERLAADVAVLRGLFEEALWVEDTDADVITYVDPSETLVVEIAYIAEDAVIEMVIALKTIPEVPGWAESVLAAETLTALDLTALPMPIGANYTGAVFQEESDLGGVPAIVVDGAEIGSVDEYMLTLELNGFIRHEDEFGEAIFNDPTGTYGLCVYESASDPYPLVIEIVDPITWADIMNTLSELAGVVFPLVEPAGATYTILTEGDPILHYTDKIIIVGGYDGEDVEAYCEALEGIGYVNSGLTYYEDGYVMKLVDGELTFSVSVIYYEGEFSLNLALFPTPLSWEDTLSKAGEFFDIEVILPEPVGEDFDFDFDDGEIIITGAAEEDVVAYEEALIAAGFTLLGADEYGDNYYLDPSGTFEVCAWLHPWYDEMYIDIFLHEEPVDETDPVVAITTAATAETGATITVEFTAEDETTAEEDLVVAIVVVLGEDPGTPVEVIDGQFTADVAGTYHVSVTVTDEAGNETVETLAIVVSDPA